MPEQESADQVPGWLRDEALTPLWAAARARLERNGVTPTGQVTVQLDRAGRHAVGGLLGRPLVRDRVRVDLAALDAVLRERSGVGGLAVVLGWLGGPVRNRVAERSSAATAREEPFTAARAWLAAHSGIASSEWVEAWLSGVRRSGLLARAGDPEAATTNLIRALQILSALTAGPAGPPAVVAPAEPPGVVAPAGPLGAVARTELAARHTGDAHALDDGTLVGALVVRGLALAAGSGAPVTPAARRALWEQYGVSPDLVSSTCLTLGLRPHATDATGWAGRMRQAADHGDPVHVTGWDLARSPLRVGPGRWVLVCENPRVLEAVAQSRSRWSDVPAVVCTSGVPGLVTVELLRRLAAARSHLAYHGDFDWPGIAMANRLVELLGAVPWLMSADDYLQAARDDGPALEGVPVEPVWTKGLGTAMRRRGVAVHEEAVIEVILDALPTT